MATDSDHFDAESTDADSTTAERATADGHLPEVTIADLGGVADADDAEAAAIAAAIAAHLRDRRAAAAAAAAEGDDGESRRSWAFVSRLEAIGEQAGRPTTTAPNDEWTAAGRADRF